MSAPLHTNFLSWWQEYNEDRGMPDGGQTFLAAMAAWNYALEQYRRTLQQTAPGVRLCAACGHPETNHNRRHRFVAP